MPQISLYVDEATLKKVETAARNRRTSISKWVVEQIKSKINPVYPNDYADLFGSIADETFSEPAELNYSADTERETL